MLSSFPAVLQAVFWPMAGGALVVALNRILPNWLGRLLALAASLASLAALFSLQGQASVGFRGTWEPFTFLRTSPVLQPTGLGQLTGIVLVAWSAVAALGIRGSQHPRTAWHGLSLVLLAGGVGMALAGNLLTLALGSALLDLGLLAMAAGAVGGAGQGQRVSFRIGVPGLISTGLLLFAALRTDTTTGTLSLSAQSVAPQVPALLLAAGLFRLAIFPLHPRGLSTPEQAATLVLSMGAGVSLLTRALVVGELPGGTPWFLAMAAAALVAGGWLAWSRGSSRGAAGGWPETWSALAMQQAGAAVLFVFLFPGAAPWPLVGLVLTLGLLAIWWDTMQVGAGGLASPPLGRLRRAVSLLRERLRALACKVLSRQGGPAPGSGAADAPEARPGAGPGRLQEGWSRLKRTWLARRGPALLPAVALASLGGAPLTAGAVIRWHLYGTLLAGARPVLLAVLLASDTLLAGGLILAWRRILRQADTARPTWPGAAAMGLLAAVSVFLWLAPRFWVQAGLPPLPRPGVSAWGIGLLFVLPWFLGAWLAKVAGAVEGFLRRLRRVADEGWVVRPAGWLGQKVVTAVYWLGSVGEGDGWWGWALIVLALGALYLVAR